MGRWGLVLLIGVLEAHAAWADDASLKALTAKLVAIRGTHGVNRMHDAGPELTPIKYDLRAWVETQLPALGQHGDIAAFTKKLNVVLHEAEPRCDETCRRKTAGNPADENERGHIGDVRLSYLGYDRYLAVQTDVGVRCGFDTSAYIYEWRNGGWRLVFKTERDAYDEKHYAPQNFISIDVASENEKKTTQGPLVLTVGYSPWCSSNWQVIYTRLWRVSATTASPAPMVDDASELFLSDDMAGARLSPDEAVVEFSGSSIDSAVLVRTHVLHYLIKGGTAERIAPVAFNPDDFVDEWLTRPWSESRQWVVARNTGALEKSYASLHEGGRPTLGEFNGPPLRCRNDPTLWQVAFGDDDSSPGPYFLVRWLAPYRFTLVDIRKEKSRDCDIADSMRDNVGTLFPFR